MASNKFPRVWVLQGQGSPDTTSPRTVQLALRDSENPVAHALLIACHDAFIKDFESLSADERPDANLPHEMFSEPRSLLTSCRKHPTNAIIANTSLFLFQILRYIAHTIPTNILSRDASIEDLGVIGLSSGLYAASVIASAHSVPSLISYAVEVFRLAFWLGLRIQQFTTREAPNDLASRWCLVVLGSTLPDIKRAISFFMAANPGSYLYITAILQSDCISVSGRPHCISAFRDGFLPSTAHTSVYAAIHALYHSPALLDVKNQVLQDVVRRRIHYPPSFSLHRSIISNVTGKPLPTTTQDGVISLVENIVETILLETANFVAVVDNIRTMVSRMNEFSSLEIINLGPGNGLSKILARTFPESKVSMVDWTCDEVEPGIIPNPNLRAVPSPDSIAIIGVAIKFPEANDLGSLWNILENGLNTISEIPSSRFRVSDLPQTSGPTQLAQNMTGNFIHDPGMFDNDFFRISPREARSMDPQQRVLLQTSYHALEHSGYVPSSTPTFDPATFGTYIGVATSDYVQNLRNNIDVYYSTGTLQAFLSGKISFAFGFSGPSIVVDTACSSSMVAIYQACRALTSGDCNAALAGGVNVITSPEMFIGLDRAHFLSPTGKCKTWDISADGYSRAEGCGMFVLKRLADAVAENDRILGVIRGIEINHSGNSESITRPHAPTQIDLFRKVLAKSGIEANQVSVMEAHGTGTQAGDQAEMEAIRVAFSQTRSRGNPLHVTSVKANIGHAEAASGAASLAKLILMFHHRTIPPQISLKQLNPRIPDLMKDFIEVNYESSPWAPQSNRRLASLSNFGAAGSNVAVILEEPPVLSSRCPTTTLRAFILGLSCDSEAALHKLRAAYLDHIDCLSDDSPHLADLCYTATARRQLYSHRLIASGTTKESLRESLSKSPVTQANEVPGKTIFVFSGLGGQYRGMGQGLYNGLPEFRKLVDHCERILLSRGYPCVRHILESDGTPLEEAGVQMVHLAMFVLEYSLACLWMEWGVLPDAVVGHSLGEYAAMVVAGVLSLESALILVAERGRLMFERCTLGSSGMLAIRASPFQIKKDLEEYKDLTIACYNSSSSCVVGGPLDALAALELRLKNADIKCVFVDVPFAQHTDAMIPVSSELTTIAKTIPISAPSIPIVSGLHGTLVPAGDSSIFDVHYFSRHCTKPVYFEDGINSLLSSGGFGSASAWIEIGPHPTCLPMLKCIPTTSEQSLHLPSLRRSIANEITLSAALASLYCHSITINWCRVFEVLHPQARLVDLPSYPFARNSFWVPYDSVHSLPKTPVILKPPQHSLLTRPETHLPNYSHLPSMFEVDFHKVVPLIEGHKVSGYALCPASVYIELAMAAALESLRGEYRGSSVILDTLSFPNALVHSPGTQKVIRISLPPTERCGGDVGSFEIISHLAKNPDQQQTNCRGSFALQSASVVSTTLSTSEPTLKSCRDSILANQDCETFRTRTIYGSLFCKVVEYASQYQAIRWIKISQDRTDAYSVCKLPPQEFTGPFVVHPILLDTLLHAAGFVVNVDAGGNEIFICHQLTKVVILPELMAWDSPFGVYCNVSSRSETGCVVEVFATQIHDDVPGAVIAHLQHVDFRRLRLSGFRTLLASSASQTENNTSLGLTPITPTTEGIPGTFGPRNSQILQIMSSVLDIPQHTLNEHADLQRLGLDSLASIEAHHSLCSSLKVKLPENLFMSCKTVKDIQDTIGRCLERDNALGHTVAIASPPKVPPRPFNLPRIEACVNVHSPNLLHPSSVIIRETLASILDVPTSQIQEKTTLVRLGMDSLMVIEARHALSTSLQIELPQDLFTCRTVGELELMIASRLYTAPITPPHRLDENAIIEANPVLLQDVKQSQKDSLFLIHDGSGSSQCYRMLCSLGRKVWGIHNPQLGTEEIWEDGIMTMAKFYADLIVRELAGETRCIIGGWSFGGIVGFEVARQLISTGIRVSGLVLIDSPDPSTRSALPDSVIDSIFSSKSATSDKAKLQLEHARVEMRRATLALVEYDHTKSSAKEAKIEKAVMLRSKEGVKLPSPYQAESTEWLADRRDSSKAVAGWEEVIGTQIPVLDIPGNHFEPFQPQNIEVVSQALNVALLMLE